MGMDYRMLMKVYAKNLEKAKGEYNTEVQGTQSLMDKVLLEKPEMRALQATEEFLKRTVQKR